jgi:hypothetical protein
MGECIGEQEEQGEDERESRTAGGGAKLSGAGGGPKLAGAGG